MKHTTHFRKSFSILLIGFILATSFTGCNHKSNALDDNNSSQTNVAQEPPLSEAEQKIATPDFLNAEQKQLYQRAKSTTSFLFIGRANIDQYPLLPSQNQITMNDSVDIDNTTYAISKGRYRNWDDFYAMIVSIYTKEYFNQINYTNEKPLFIAHEGRLCFLDSDRGTNINLTNKPDGFELIRKTDDTIQFNVIGYYLEEDGKDNWEERREKGEYNTTKKYPITLTKTKDGWRVSEFHITM